MIYTIIVPLESNNRYLWIVDPLDGTTNFSTMNPFFAVSIALLKDYKSLLGVVFYPFQNELFYAIKGKGAFLNDRKLICRSNKKFEDAFIAYGLWKWT